MYGSGTSQILMEECQEEILFKCGKCQVEELQKVIWVQNFSFLAWKNDDSEHIPHIEI